MLKKIIALFLSVIAVISISACATPTETPQEMPSQTPGDISELPSSTPNINIPAVTIQPGQSEATPMPFEPTEIGNPATKPTPVPTPDFPEYATESVKLSELEGYTIIYPSVYTDYRMNEVYILRDTIRDILGFELEIKPDTDTVDGKKIILASSIAENGVEEAIKLFQSGMDYVVGTLNGNIILGGNNFYADMRAIYDFINNYLGYDDIEDAVISEPKTEISGVNLDIYREPELTLLACSYSVSAFTEQFVIRDMAEAHFNMAQMEGVNYTAEAFRDLIKWCARYEIRLAFRGALDHMIANADCPVIVSGIVRDEPHVSAYLQYSKESEVFLEKYGEYGWYPYVNYFGYRRYWDTLIEIAGIFDSVPFVSFDQYLAHSILNTFADRLTVFEDARELAERKGQNWYSYIECYNITNRNQNPNKMIRWASYIAACFDVDGILYFQYGDASPNYTAEGDWSYGSLINWDFTKNPAWYDAKENNEEMMKIYSIYSKMDYVGAATLNAALNEHSIYLEDGYPYVDRFIEDIKYESAKKDAYLLGLYEDEDKKGITFVNLADLDNEKYDESTPKNIKIKLNGENATFYFRGEPVEVECDADDYYNLNMANGYCWFITVE